MGRTKHLVGWCRFDHPPYQAKDQSAVVQLWLDCGFVVSHNNPVRDIKRKSSVNPEWFLIGEIGDRVVASCMAGYEGHRGWINYLAVAPTEQNKTARLSVDGASGRTASKGRLS